MYLIYAYVIKIPYRSITCDSSNNSPSRSSTIVSVTYNRILRPLSLSTSATIEKNKSPKSGHIKMTYGFNGKIKLTPDKKTRLTLNNMRPEKTFFDIGIIYFYNYNLNT